MDWVWDVELCELRNVPVELGKVLVDDGSDGVDVDVDNNVDGEEDEIDRAAEDDDENELKFVWGADEVDEDEEIEDGGEVDVGCGAEVGFVLDTTGSTLISRYK